MRVLWGGEMAAPASYEFDIAIINTNQEDTYCRALIDSGAVSWTRYLQKEQPERKAYKSIVLVIKFQDDDSRALFRKILRENGINAEYCATFLKFVNYLTSTVKKEQKKKQDVRMFDDFPPWDGSVSEAVVVEPPPELPPARPLAIWEDITAAVESGMSPSYRRFYLEQIAPNHAKVCFNKWTKIKDIMQKVVSVYQHALITDKVVMGWHNQGLMNPRAHAISAAKEAILHVCGWQDAELSHMLELDRAYFRARRPPT